MEWGVFKVPLPSLASIYILPIVFFQCYSKTPAEGPQLAQLICVGGKAVGFSQLFTS